MNLTSTRGKFICESSNIEKLTEMYGSKDKNDLIKKLYSNLKLNEMYIKKLDDLAVIMNLKYNNNIDSNNFYKNGEKSNFYFLKTFFNYITTEMINKPSENQQSDFFGNSNDRMSINEYQNINKHFTLTKKKDSIKVLKNQSLLKLQIQNIENIHIEGITSLNLGESDTFGDFTDRISIKQFKKEQNLSIITMKKESKTSVRLVNLNKLYTQNVVNLSIAGINTSVFCEIKQKNLTIDYLMNTIKNRIFLIFIYSENVSINKFLEKDNTEIKITFNDEVINFLNLD